MDKAFKLGRRFEDGVGQNGVFTGALLEALENPGRRFDGIFNEAASLVEQRTSRQQVL